MAKYSKLSPLFSKRIRILAGSAVYSEIATATGGIWDPCELEDLLDENRDGFTGMYRKLPTGVVLKPETCERIQNGRETMNLFYWRDLPLWILLSEHLVGTKIYNQLLEDAWDPTDEKYLLPNDLFLNNSDFWFKEATWHGLQNVEDNNVESLVFYTARLRKSIDKNLLPLIYRYSIVTHYILDKLIYKIPQLYIRWPLLLKIYRDDLWPMEIPKNHLKHELNITLRVMNKPHLDPAKYSNDYPPKHMHRRMNLQYLNSMYAQ